MFINFTMSLMSLAKSKCNFSLTRKFVGSCYNSQHIIQYLSPCTTSPVLPVSCCLVNQVRTAGHSKWQNIKDIKTTKDGARALIFAKCASQIKVSLRGSIFFMSLIIMYILQTCVLMFPKVFVNIVIK